MDAFEVSFVLDLLNFLKNNVSQAHSINLKDTIPLAYLSRIIKKESRTIEKEEL